MSIINKLDAMDANELIAVPSELKTQDGRVLKIIEWRPCVIAGRKTTVSIEAIIELSPPPVDIRAGL